MFIKKDKRKAIYDQFGEEGLKSGVPLDKENWSEPYTFCGDPNKIFYEFFGGDNPFAGKNKNVILRYITRIQILKYFKQWIKVTWKIGKAFLIEF